MGSRFLELERTRGQISVTVKVASRNRRHVRYTVCPKKVESILTRLSSPVVLAKNIYTCDVDSGTNHVHGRPSPIAAPVILIPRILFTRLSHSHPCVPEPLWTLELEAHWDHLSFYPLELR